MNKLAATIIASILVLMTVSAQAGEVVQIVNDNCEDSDRYIGSDNYGNYYLLETFDYVSSGDTFVGDFRTFGYEDTFNQDDADEVEFYIEDFYVSEDEAVEFCFN